VVYDYEGKVDLSNPYENLQPDTAKIQPDSSQEAFFMARMEQDKARHEIFSLYN